MVVTILFLFMLANIFFLRRFFCNDQPVKEHLVRTAGKEVNGYCFEGEVVPIKMHLI
jgi:hypothetical protein